MESGPCVGIPEWIVNCVLIYLFASAILGTVFNKFSGKMWATIWPLSDDYDENVRMWQSAAFFGALMAIVGLGCYFYFMYPDMKSIQSGMSSCSSVITPFGGQ